MSTVTRILRLATSRSGLALLDTIIGAIEDLRAKGHGNEAIRLRVQSIRDAVRASDARDVEMLDRYFPPVATATKPAAASTLPPNPYIDLKSR
jgi:hypothetical protein